MDIFSSDDEASWTDVWNAEDNAQVKLLQTILDNNFFANGKLSEEEFLKKLKNHMPIQGRNVINKRLSQNEGR